jgi:hypothetical protein
VRRESLCSQFHAGDTRHLEAVVPDGRIVMTIPLPSPLALPPAVSGQQFEVPSRDRSGDTP